MNQAYGHNGDATPALVDSVANTVAQVGPALSRLSADTAQLTRRGVEAVREQAIRASDSTRGYIRDEPVKSVLIAAAVGASLIALLALVSRTRGAN